MSQSWHSKNAFERRWNARLGVSMLMPENLSKCPFCESYSTENHPRYWPVVVTYLFPVLVVSDASPWRIRTGHHDFRHWPGIHQSGRGGLQVKGHDPDRLRQHPSSVSMRRLNGWKQGTRVSVKSFIFPQIFFQKTCRLSPNISPFRTCWKKVLETVIPLNNG